MSPHKYGCVHQFLSHGLETPECPICHEPYTSSSPDGKETLVRTRECGHYFHNDCLQIWVEREGRNTCPTCRHVLFRGEPTDEDLIEAVNNFNIANRTLGEILQDFAPADIERIRTGTPGTAAFDELLSMSGSGHGTHGHVHDHGGVRGNDHMHPYSHAHDHGHPVTTPNPPLRTRVSRQNRSLTRRRRETVTIPGSPTRRGSTPRVLMTGLVVATGHESSQRGCSGDETVCTVGRVAIRGREGADAEQAS